MSTQQITRISVYAKRRHDLTPGQFYDYWENVHAKLAVPWLVKYGVVAYSQIHCAKPSHRPDPSDGALPPPFEYDGVAEFDVSDMALFSSAFQDPFYVEVIKPDEVNFLDTTMKLIRTMGPLKPLISENKAVVEVEKEQGMLDKYQSKTMQEKDVQ